MSERREPFDPEPARDQDEGEPAPMKFKGIVETDADRPAPKALRSPGAAPYQGPDRRRRGGVNWNAMARQTMLVTRLIAVFWLFAVFVGWPVGDWLAVKSTGTGAGWTIWHAVSFEGFLLAIVASFLTLLVGYIASRLLHTVSAAETIAHAANQLISPDVNAAENVRHVGAAVRGEMEALHVGLDQALSRLAAVEAMIRQHVEAIETAGESIETRAAGAVGRVANERARLIELTEQLNTQADAFAAAIAAKAQASIEALHSADDLSDRAQAYLEDRLHRLDIAAQQAVHSFNSLGAALEAGDETVRGSAGRIEASTAEVRRAVELSSKSAEAAAESAARNAANVGAAAARASADAERAASQSIEASSREAHRAAQAAIEATEREANRIAEAADKALSKVKQSTQSAIAAVTENAARATDAADRVALAAQRASEAAAAASGNIVKASDEARRNAEAAFAASEQNRTNVEARNRALAEARAALEEENGRLEALIAEQRARADRLADAIATQTERLSKLAETQIREQEAQARYAEAQAEKARVAEEARKADEAKRMEEARAEADAARARAAEAARLASEEGATRASAEAARRAADAAAEDADGVLDLEKASRPAATNGKAGPRQRLDELADDIAQRRQKPAGDPARRDKGSVSWREILDATDEAGPLDLAAASVTPPQPGPPVAGAAAQAIKIISGLQSFTFDLECRLYGDPPSALRERFERGDRNVFANRLLRLNDTDVKRRIRAEASRDKGFERDVHEFLQGFERLLEDATTSETADEDLEEYLSSPLGRVYLLIGATVGYFA